MHLAYILLSFLLPLFSLATDKNWCCVVTWPIHQHQLSDFNEKAANVCLHHLGCIPLADADRGTIDSRNGVYHAVCRKCPDDIFVAEGTADLNGLYYNCHKHHSFCKMHA